CVFGSIRTRGVASSGPPARIAYPVAPTGQCARRGAHYGHGLLPVARKRRCHLLQACDGALAGPVAAGPGTPPAPSAAPSSDGQQDHQPGKAVVTAWTRLSWQVVAPSFTTWPRREAAATGCARVRAVGHACCS